MPRPKCAGGVHIYAIRVEGRLDPGRVVCLCGGTNLHAEDVQQQLRI